MSAVSAPLENLLIAKTLETISGEDVRYVGIVSSDMRDKIYLAQLISDYCPDVRVFFTDNDLFLTFPEFSHYLEGALVASTYPLVSCSQMLDFPYRGTRRS